MAIAIRIPGILFYQLSFIAHAKLQELIEENRLDHKVHQMTYNMINESLPLTAVQLCRIFFLFTSDILTHCCYTTRIVLKPQTQ